MRTDEQSLEPTIRRGFRFGRLTIPFYYLNALIPLIFSMILPGMERLYAVLITALFVYIYYLSFRGSTLQKFTTICIQFVLVLVMVCWFSIGFAWMIFFPSASIGLLPSRKMVDSFAVALVLVNLLGGVLTVQWLHQPADSWTMFLAALFAGLGSVYGVRFQRQITASRASLQRANETIEHLTTMAERERISRDLHDVMGHELSMITLKSQLAERLIDRNPEQAKQEIRDIQNAARDALAQVREYIADMRQPSLSTDTDRARRMLESAGIACDLSGLETLQSIERATPLEQIGRDSSQVLTTLSLCIREAVTNIVKHSEATHAKMRLHVGNGHFHFTLSDDGVGLQRDALTEPRRIGGIGLSGMIQRLVDLGGSFRLWSNGELLLAVDAATHYETRINSPSSALNRGTTLSFMVPFQQFLSTEQGEVTFS